MELACVVTPDGSKLVAISDVFAVWDLETKTRILYEPALWQCLITRITHDGNFVIVENEYYDVMVVDIKTGEILHMLSFDGIVTVK